MSRNKHTISLSKYTKYTKGGYKVDRNGVPLDYKGGKVMNTHNYHYNGMLKVGKYRPTIHNITDI